MVVSPAIWKGMSLLFKDLRTSQEFWIIFGILIVCQFQSVATGAAAFYPLSQRCSEIYCKTGNFRVRFIFANFAIAIKMRKLIFVNIFAHHYNI